MSEEHATRLRLAELMRLRQEFAAQGKPNIVSFLDGLIADAQSAVVALESTVEPEASKTA